MLAESSEWKATAVVIVGVVLVTVENSIPWIIGNSGFFVVFLAAS